MSFDVAGDAYERYMGRYSRPLAAAFADFARIAPGLTLLDVGCGSGALTDELIARVGEAGVSAADPSAQLVAAVRQRHPRADVRTGAAEDLPFPDDEFDATLAQLVVHFMTDPVAGLREMARVTRGHGTVAACVWDHAGRNGPLAVFWEAARRTDPGLRDEAEPAGTRGGDLTRLMTAAGLKHVHEEPLTVRVRHETFEEWWEPYLLGVGPSGTYAAALDENRRERLRETCRELLPEPPFTIAGTVWAARGTV